MNWFLLRIANLNLAERDGLFFITSFTDGLIILFEYFSKRNKLSFVSSGKYLEGFDLFSEKLLKKNLIILSSIEWKLIVKIFPPGFKVFVAFIKPFISS